MKEAQLTTPNTLDDELLALMMTTAADGPITTAVTTQMVTTKPTTVKTTAKTTLKRTKAATSLTTYTTKPMTLATQTTRILTQTVPKTTGAMPESLVNSTIVESSTIEDRLADISPTTRKPTIASTTAMSLLESASVMIPSKLSENNNPTMNLLNNLFPLTRTTMATLTSSITVATTIVRTLEKKIKPIPKPTQQSTLGEKSVLQTKEIPDLTTKLEYKTMKSTTVISTSLTAPSPTTTSLSTKSMSSTRPTIISKTTTTVIPTTDLPTTSIATTTVLTTTDTQTTSLLTTSLVTTTSGLGDFIPIPIKVPERTFKLPKPTKPKSTASPLPLSPPIPTPSTLLSALMSRRDQSFDALFPSLSKSELVQKTNEPQEMSLEEVLAAMNIEPTELTLESTLESILETTLEPITTILPTTQQQTMTTTSGLGDFIPVSADFFQPEVQQNIPEIKQNIMTSMPMMTTSKITSTTSFPLLDFLDSILGPPQSTTSLTQLPTLPTSILTAQTIPTLPTQSTSTARVSITTSSNVGLNDPVVDSDFPPGDEDYDLDLPPIIQNLLEPLDTGTMWMSTTLVAIETTTFPTTTSFVSYTVPTMQPPIEQVIPTPTAMKPTVSTESTTKISPVIVGNPVTTTQTTTMLVNNRIQINNSTTNSTSIPTSSSDSSITDCQFIIFITFLILVF